MFYKKNTREYVKLLDEVEFISLVDGNKTHMTEFRLEKGSTIPLHSYSQEQTGYLVSGKLKFKVAGETIEAEAGDAWNLGSNVEHGVEVIEDSLVIEIFSPPREDYLRHFKLD